MVNTNIIVAGCKFDTGCRVVLWDEPNGLNFYPYKRFHARNWNLKKCRKKINSFYIHHSVTYTAGSMFTGLRARGLSCNFMIDDDINEDGCATLYQCLDVKDAGWSQGGMFNHNGPGVELAYMPDAWDHPDRYSDQNIKKWGVCSHPMMPETVQGMKFSKVFGPTEAQVKSCIKLTLALKEAFPDLTLEFPKDRDGNILQRTVNNPSQAQGLLYHWHVRKDKIDPMGFPGKMVEEEAQRLHLFNQVNKKSLLQRLFGFIKKRT